MKREPRAVWAGRVKRLKASGLSLRQFAAREGFKAGSLSFWKWKLAQDRGERAAPLAFVELTATAPTTAAPFEIALGSGRTLRVPNGFDAAELARLVALLEEVRA